MDFIFELLSNADIDIAGMVDIKLVFGLLAIGFILKHSIKKLSNEFIPVILIVSSLMVNFMNIGSVTPGNIANTFMNAILSAAVAIGMHQGGKGFLKAVASSASSAADKFTDELDNNKSEQK